MSDKRFTAEDAQLFEEILKHRRDIRGNRFLPDPISDQDIDKLIDAALYSPSVGFSQPWEFVVIRDDEIKSQVQNVFEIENTKGAQHFENQKQQTYLQLKLEGIKDAPVNMAVFYNPVNGPVLGQTSMKDVGLFSVVCAVQNMWLMARAKNIGVGWVSILDPIKIHKILQVPDDRKLVAYLCIGKVTEFTDKPELETLGWEKRKQKASIVFSDSHSQHFYSEDD